MCWCPDQSKVLLCLYPLFCRDLIANIDCDVLYVVQDKGRGEEVLEWRSGGALIVGE